MSAAAPAAATAIVSATIITLKITQPMVTKMRPRTVLALLAITIIGLAPPSGAQGSLPPSVTPQPSITLPPPLDRVLRDYERAWRAKDAAGLAALFTEDGMILSNGKPANRGRVAVREGYATSGGPLALRAVAYATADTVGYIIGGYAQQAGEADAGKFVLAVRKGGDGRWYIAADIENSSHRPQMRSMRPDSTRRMVPPAL